MRTKAISYQRSLYNVPAKNESTHYDANTMHTIKAEPFLAGWEMLTLVHEAPVISRSSRIFVVELPVHVDITIMGFHVDGQPLVGAREGEFCELFEKFEVVALEKWISQMQLTAVV